MGVSVGASASKWERESGVRGSETMWEQMGASDTGRVGVMSERE